MLELKGRTVQKTIQAEAGLSILDHAIKHDVDWGFSCTEGRCARCRCYIEEGREFMSEPNDAELDRLDMDEIEQGYRLGCQAEVKSEGFIKAINKTYF